MSSSVKYKVNISIDDVSPHPKAGVGVLDRCYELIEVFPTIKFTLFVPLCYTRFLEDSYPISEYPEFCKILKELSVENFEIGAHGYQHGIPHISSNDEFKSLDYDQAISKFKLIQEEIDRADLKSVFKPIFRPPAWRMSADSIRAAKDFGIKILGLSTWDYALQTYGGEDKNFKSVVYENCCPPHKPLELLKNTEIVYHSCEWDKNYLSVDNKKELENFLKENINEIEFSNIGDLI